MTKISICMGPDTLSITMDGHAGFNPGNDVVCAGLSAIMTALQGYLNNIPERCTIITKPGHCVAQAPCDMRLISVFELAEIGFLQIEAAYPDNVSVSHLDNK